MMSDKAYELSPIKLRLIHSHMKHNKRTADANYVIKLNAECASKAHELMQNIIAETVPAGASGVSSTREQEKKVETAPALAPGVLEKKAEVVSLDKKTDEVNLAEDKDEDMDDDLPLRCATEKWKLTAQEGRNNAS